MTRPLFLALLAAAVLSPLNSTMIAVVMPSICHDFAIDAGSATVWLVTSYLLVSIVCLAPAGWLGDLIGHGRVLAAGQLVLALGTTLALFSPNIASLGLARVLMAAGGALVIPTSMALMRLLIAPDRLIRAFSVFGACMAGAAAAGPLFGGLIGAHLGWHAVFAMNAPLLLTSFLLGQRAFRVHRSAASGPRRSFDVIGCAMLAGALSLVVIGVKGADDLRVTTLGAALITAIAFVVREHRAADPILHPGLFRIRTFSVGSLIVALQNFSMYTILFELPQIFPGDSGSHAAGDRATGVSPHVGLALAALTGAMMACAPLGSRLAERVGARGAVVLGALLATVGTMPLLDAAAVSPIAAIPWLLVIGGGLGLSVGPSQASALAAVDRSRSGMASGAMNIARYLGALCGTALLGVLLRAAPAGGEHANERIGFICFAAAFAMSLLMGLALPGRKPASFVQNA